MISEEELARRKAEVVAARTGAEAAPRLAGPGAVWRIVDFPTTADAVNFANVPPVQQGGEFGVTDDPAGGVHGYYFF
jgi:hypothetical protein